MVTTDIEGFVTSVDRGDIVEGDVVADGVSVAFVMLAQWHSGLKSEKCSAEREELNGSMYFVSM